MERWTKKKHVSLSDVPVLCYQKKKNSPPFFWHGSGKAAGLGIQVVGDLESLLSAYISHMYVVLIISKYNYSFSMLKGNFCPSSKNPFKEH